MCGCVGVEGGGGGGLCVGECGRGVRVGVSERRCPCAAAARPVLSSRQGRGQGAVGSACLLGTAPRVRCRCRRRRGAALLGGACGAAGCGCVPAAASCATSGRDSRQAGRGSRRGHWARPTSRPAPAAAQGAQLQQPSHPLPPPLPPSPPRPAQRCMRRRRSPRHARSCGRCHRALPTPRPRATLSVRAPGLRRSTAAPSRCGWFQGWWMGVLGAVSGAGVFGVGCVFLELFSGRIWCLVVLRCMCACTRSEGIRRLW